MLDLLPGLKKASKSKLKTQHQRSNLAVKHKSREKRQLKSNMLISFGCGTEYARLLYDELISDFPW